MSPQMTVAVQLTGLLAMLGAALYAVADVLLLAGQARLADYPALQPHAKLLSGTERMAGLSPARLMWGGLLGVFVTPLVLAGFWHVFQGLSRAPLALSLPPALLFGAASVVGAFVHGSFIYLGEYVQALNCVSRDDQPVLLAMFARHKRILIITYGFLLACVLVASAWFSVLVAAGLTWFPRWMAAVNPVTALAAWMLLKRLLPKAAGEWTEGAGFNIAYLAFFAFTTATLWAVG